MLSAFYQRIFRNVPTLKCDSKRMIQILGFRSSGFSKDEEKKIIDTVNNASVDDLEKYNIKRSDLKKLLIYREKHGRFEVFEDILLTQDVPSFIKFSRSILKIKNKMQKIKTKERIPSIAPPINSIAKQNFKSALAIEVWIDRICWARIDENKCLTHWDSSVFCNPSKTTLIPFIDSIMEIISQLPLADAYVMESDKYTMLNKLSNAGYTSHLQRQQAIAIIITIIKAHYQLNIIKDNDFNSNFYMLRESSSARRYNLLVGSEKISKESTTTAILEDILNKKNELITAVDPKILQKYPSTSSTIREQLNSVLLILLTFIELLK